MLLILACIVLHKHAILEKRPEEKKAATVAYTFFFFFTIMNGSTAYVKLHALGGGNDDDNNFCYDTFQGILSPIYSGFSSHSLMQFLLCSELHQVSCLKGWQYCGNKIAGGLDGQF